MKDREREIEELIERTERSMARRQRVIDDQQTSLRVLRGELAAIRQEKVAA